MKRLPTPSILYELQNPTSTSNLVVNLRRLKNELIGHDQRKEDWIGHGIIPVLSRILTSRKASGKRSRETNGEGTLLERRKGLTDEDEACLQAVTIVGSLAQGGCPFVTPMLHGNIIPPMMTILSSQSCPSALTLCVLRALNAIADAIPLLDKTVEPALLSQLTILVHSRDHVGTLSKILGNYSSSSNAQQCISLAASLICKTCRDESHKIAITESGGLDALAMRLASFVVSQGFVLPGAESHAQGHLPPSAPTRVQLAPILRAVAIIVERSETRAEQLLASPALVSVFPKPFEFSPNDIKKNPWNGGTYLSGFAVPRRVVANAIDVAVLPPIPVPHNKVPPNQSIHFPALGASNGGQKLFSHSRTEGPSTFFSSLQSEPEADGDESAFVSWLVHLVRVEKGMTRLMAARLVVALFRLGLAKKHRIPMFGLLLVPLLVRMLDKDYVSSGEEEFADLFYPPGLCIKEEAPSILAALVMDDESLQKAAVDGHAIKKLSVLLKEAYSPIVDTTQIKTWRTDSSDGSPTRDSRNQPAMRLGKPSQPFLAPHKMRLREGLLRALAAIAPFKDEYRKAICDNGVVPYIIDSLKPAVPFPSNYEQPAKTPMTTIGNPTPTLLAACEAARALTRSVSILRTSLIDAGVAPPLFALLKYSDVDVQIAATAVICNLALDFSPMKDAIVQAGVLTTLYEHAHSSNRKLRLDTLWALKHLVYNAPNDLKMNIVAQLGPSWLVQVLTSEPETSSRRQGADENEGPVTMGTPNSMGEQVDILNPIDEKESTLQDDESEDLKMADSTSSLRDTSNVGEKPATSRRTAFGSHGLEEYAKQAKRDNYAVQEQAMDLIRNLTCGNGAHEMIDFLFQELGEERFMNMLTEKLKLPPGPDSEQRGTGTPYDIAEKATFVLIHIAASLPRHRHLLIKQTELLEYLIPLFKNPNNTIRINAVWIVINLTWVDDPSDRPNSKERAEALRKLGFWQQLKDLQEDSELDVRERTKTAIHQMKDLIRELS